MFEKITDTHQRDDVITPSSDGFSEEFMEAVRTRDPRLVWTDSGGNRISPHKNRELKMNIADMRERARAAVDAARFVSALPVGECGEATVLMFFYRRREEIIAEARRALNDGANILSAEAILCLLYGEVSEEEFAIQPAA